jgi:uncharacterized integral membrane protein
VRVWLTALVALAASALLVYAALQNSQPVSEVNWVFGSARDVPLWRALAVSALLGGLLTALILAVPAVRLRLRLMRAERRISQLEREVHGLRTLPLDDEVRDAQRES